MPQQVRALQLGIARVRAAEDGGAGVEQFGGEEGAVEAVGAQGDRRC